VGIIDLPNLGASLSGGEGNGAHIKPQRFVAPLISIHRDWKDEALTSDRAECGDAQDGLQCFRASVPMGEALWIANVRQWQGFDIPDTFRIFFCSPV